MPATLLAEKKTLTISHYGSALCNYPQYQCIKVSRGQNWEKLFPDPYQRDLVQRLNRTYNRLQSGKIIAIPRHIEAINLLDLSPFQLKISPSTEKQIIVDQDKLAWAAYDEQGQLVKWGPISSGQDKCSDSNRSCLTLTGIFRVFSKENEHCVSNAFPEGIGGAKMPFCMFFHKGFALHGSDDIPGHRASHGCVRLFVQDAKWLNENFVQTSNKKNNFLGTLVIVKPLLAKGIVSINNSEDSEEIN
ncbi:L,D-transpeptidase [Legionella fairfieldensis]|uniref:L,D-transpeptidase n=1 Tax=Legionella fairfieldensis TaxID=45064 RepID=UPI001F5F8BA5|nr:L,D-transpeptidase [Legionella fairfieldensis]